jgi:ABC-type antimicrobial peptide transport system permease subunit
VLVSTLRLALAGMAIGLLLTFLVGKVMTSLLYETSPWDLPTYLGMAIALLLVALTSGYLPARRASAVNPLVALRNN